nr:glutamate receptor ionotropic, delta-2-like [Procambarus clarkii]
MLDEDKAICWSRCDKFNGICERLLFIPQLGDDVEDEDLWGDVVFSLPHYSLHNYLLPSILDNVPLTWGGIIEEQEALKPHKQNEPGYWVKQAVTVVKMVTVRKVVSSKDGYSEEGRKLWVMLLVTVVIWGVTLWLLQRAWQWVTGGRPVALNATILYAWGALLQNLPSQPSATFSGRMLVGWWLVFCLIVTTGFTSSLVAHLTVQGRSRPLETFQDLVNQPGWTWGTPQWVLSEAVVDYFIKHPNPAVNEVYHKMEIIKEADPLKMVLAGGLSLIFPKNFAIINVATRYTDERGNTPFYISRGIPMVLSMGWCIRKGAPFRQRFNQLLTRLDAAGVITSWTDDVMAKKVKEMRKALKSDTNPILGDAIQDDGQQMVLSLNHLQGAFYMLLVGSCVAFLTLLVENLAHCCSSPQ